MDNQARWPLAEAQQKAGELDVQWIEPRERTGKDAMQIIGFQVSE